MAEIALKDVNKIPESERMNGISSNGSLVKPPAETINQISEEMTNKVACLVESVKLDVPENQGGVTNSEVEYIESEKLADVEDVEGCLKTLLVGLGSKDWVAVCDSLNNVRRFSIYHKDYIIGMLNEIISFIVKSLKNPRSAVCKTAIMTSADIFKAYTDDIVDLLDPLLVQLLLKSSQDKRFVCEAAESALMSLTRWVSPLLLLPKLQPHIKNRNPRIRAKASMCISRSVPRLGVDEIEEFGIDKLLEIGASQLSDQLPESRDAARSLLLELQSVFEKFHVLEQTSDGSTESCASTWEHFCQSKLSPLSAQAVLRVTNISREGIALGS